MQATDIFTRSQIDVISSIIQDQLQKNKPATKKEFVPVADFCKDNSISKSKLYKLRKDGVITFYKFGEKNVFVKLSEVERLMTAA